MLVSSDPLHTWVSIQLHVGRESTPIGKYEITGADAAAKLKLIDEAVKLILLDGPD